MSDEAAVNTLTAGPITGRWPDALAAAILVALPTFFFWNVLAGNQLLTPDNFTRYSPWDQILPSEFHDAPQARLGWADPLIAYYPRAYLTARVFQQGELPLWNPYAFSGMPFIADIQSAVFYPGSLLLVFFAPAKAYGYSAWLHITLLGLFGYAYLRLIRLIPPAALLGGVTLMFCNVIISRSDHISRTSTLTWLPGLFLALEFLVQTEAGPTSSFGFWARLRQLPASLRAIPLALGVALSILAGMTPITVLSFYLLASYGVFRIFLLRREAGAGLALKLALTALVAVAIGIALTGVQLFPSIELNRYNGGGDDNRAILYSAPAVKDPWLFALTAFMPEIVGNPIIDPNTFQAVGSYLGIQSLPYIYVWVGAIYIGMAPLLLVVGAILGNRHSKLFTAFFATAAAVLLLFMLSPVLAALAYAYLPGWQTGAGLRLLAPLALALAVLAALGADQAARFTGRNPGLFGLAVLALVGGLAMVVAAAAGGTVWRLNGNLDWLGPILAGRAEDALRAEIVPAWYANLLWGGLVAGLATALAGMLMTLRLSGKLSGELTVWLFAALTIADLLFFARRLTPPPQSPGSIYPPTPFIEFLLQDEGPYRVIRLITDGSVLRLAPPNMLTVYGVQDAQGYNTLNLQYYGEFMELMAESLYPTGHRYIDAIRDPAHATSPLLDLLNVKYILTPANATVDLQNPLLHDEIRLVYDGEVKIYQNIDVLPRAFVPETYVLVSGDAEMRTSLQDPAFAPQSKLLITGPAPDGSTSGSISPGSTIRIRDFGLNEVVIECDMTQAGFVVLGDVYYPGWQVFVDEEEAQLYPADSLLRAVWVTEGDHTVRFVYNPASFRIGRGVTLIALASLCLAPVVEWFGRKRLARNK